LVLCVCDVSAAVKEVEAEVGPPPEGVNLKVQAVRRTAAELQMSSSEAAKALDGAGIQRFGGEIDLSLNQLHVSVSPADLAQAQELLAPEILVSGDLLEAVPDVNKSFDLGFNVVEGGQMIGQTTASNAVTSAFAVQNGYGPFILTAAHAMDAGVGLGPCSNLGAPWYQGGRLMGTASFCYYGGSLEIGGISTYGVRSNFGTVHYTSTDDMHQITFPVLNQNLFGQTVCQTGKTTTGTTGNLNLTGRCGTVQTLAARPNYTRPGSPAFTYSFGSVTYLHDGGDSGAAVVWPTGYGFGAAGIHSGGFASGGNGLFTQYSNAANSLGLTLSPY
jgi:hypothetical protein